MARVEKPELMLTAVRTIHGGIPAGFKCESFSEAKKPRRHCPTFIQSRFKHGYCKKFQVEAMTGYPNLFAVRS